MIGARTRLLGVRVETLRVLSSTALDGVVGGAGDPRVPDTALPAKAHVGAGISTVLQQTGRCRSCFC